MGQHFVPQRYLRNFEDPNSPDHIWQYDKQQIGAPRCLPIVKVAQSNKFYQPQTEKELAKCESNGNAVIAKLIDQSPITFEERAQMAYYTAVMLMRIPARRQVIDKMAPEVLSDVISNIRKELESNPCTSNVDSEQRSQTLAEVDAVEEKYSNTIPNEVIEQAYEPWPTEKVFRVIFYMTWRILVSAGTSYFITTDNPVFFFRDRGLATNNAELSFPLSRTHALHGSWQSAASDLVFLPASQSIVKEINRRLVSMAVRFAFYHQSVMWLGEILSKRNLKLHQIKW